MGCKCPGVSLCKKCLSTIPLSDTIKEPYTFALYDYNNPLVRHSIWALKYRHHTAPAKGLVSYGAPYVSAFLSEVVQSTVPESFILVPIPQHRNKTHERGYNQGRLLAQWLAKSIEGARVAEVLIKTIPTIPQARIKHKSARIKNIAHSMRASAPLDPRALYIIVDDVTTTGATMNEARRALKAYGGKKIIALSLAHGNFSA
ncbi:MAG: ComF family protein [Minisyncoccia bacterium]